MGFCFKTFSLGLQNKYPIRDIYSAWREVNFVIHLGPTARAWAIGVLSDLPFQLLVTLAIHSISDGHTPFTIPSNSLEAGVGAQDLAQSSLIMTVGQRQKKAEPKRETWERRRDSQQAGSQQCFHMCPKATQKGNKRPADKHLRFCGHFCLSIPKRFTNTREHHWPDLTSGTNQCPWGSACPVSTKAQHCEGLALPIHHTYLCPQFSSATTQKDFFEAGGWVGLSYNLGSELQTKFWSVFYSELFAQCQLLF